MIKLLKLKRIIACLLVFVLVTSSGFTVLAESSSDRGGIEQSVFNDELIRFLADEYGVENAASMYQTIQNLGLIDLNGQFLSHPIYLNGTGYTLDEIKEIISDENTDLTQLADIDGEHVSLDTLKEIISIEDYIELLGQTISANNVKITPEHVDSLSSLIEQTSSEGLEINTEEDIDITNVTPLAVNDDYDDETYITVTKYASPEHIASYVELTFTLSKPQTEHVSFSYELVEGTLGAELNSSTNTVIFNPGQVSKKISIGPKSTPGRSPGSYLMSPEPNELYQSEYINGVWNKYARADYIHFYNFKNFDYMNFDMEMFTQKDLGYRIEEKVSGNRVFTHSYDGGAYVAFIPKKNSGGRSYLVIPPDDGEKYYVGELFRIAELLGMETHESTDFDILKVEAREGNYTTGQILPYKVTYNKLVLHKLPVDVPENNPRLELANGDIATPSNIAPSSISRLAEYVNYDEQQTGGLSYVQGYQTVIKKNTTLEDLKVMLSAGEGDPLHYYYVDDSLPIEHADKVYPDTAWNKSFTNNPNITISYAKSDAFNSIALDKSSYSIGDTATVTVQLDNGDGEADWIIDGGQTADEISKKLIVSIGNRDQGKVELDWKKDENGQPASPLALQGTFNITEDLYGFMSATNRPDGKLRAKVYYNRDSNNQEGIENFGLLADMFAPFTIGAAQYITPDDISIVYPSTWPSGVVNQVVLTNPEDTQLGYSVPDDATYRTPDQFAWSSNDNSIASITDDGIIVPHEEGIVTFTLTAKNNGMLTSEKTTKPIEIKAGGPPSVVVPNFANIVYVQKYRDANLYWLTNVMSKYKENAGTGNAPADANFTVELYIGNLSETDILSHSPTMTWSAPATQGLINATSFTIKGQYMDIISDEHTPSYTVRISTPHPIDQGKTLSALSYIVVKSPPAVIELDKSMGQYITDTTKSIDLTWNLANFDTTNKGDFEFKVTKNGVLVPESVITFDKESGSFTDQHVTETGGTYTLRIDPISPNNQNIKDVYTINLAAKNNLDSTWSYDSLYLQVYKHDGLAIQIDGVSKTAYTMSNEKRIKDMSNDERVALKRNISLKNQLSINYKDYTDLGEITDQLKWQSSNNDVGVIHFNSQGKISDITSLNYSSYQPKHNFMLGGIEDGQTTITATHAKTGMKAELDVTVETLRDKLYVFQFYPKATTAVKYTDRRGVEHTVESNAKGELALYDENGIGSDVYVTSTFNKTTYTGVISHETLLSKEKDPAMSELYPINILQLRKLSEVEIFFKTLDGNPYTGSVTYRGGVYKNGNYCELTEISGAGVTSKLGADGRLEVIFDTTDFYSKQANEENAATLSAKDQIDIVFEFTFEDDRYLPQLITFDGNSNAVDMIAFSQKISRLIENPTSDQSTIMTNQYITEDSTDNKTSILTYRGKFGPNNQFPNVTLTTEFMWRGEEVDEGAYVELYNEVGYKPHGQSYQALKYPFSNTLIIRHQQALNKDTIWLEKAESGSIQYKLYDGIKEFKKSFITTATLTNMIGVEEINTQDLSSLLDEIRKDMNGTTTNSTNPSPQDQMISDAMELFGKLSFNIGSLKMKIIPTDDPLIYKTIIASSFGNLPSAVAGNSGGSSSNVEFLQDRKTTLVPGLMDGYRLYNETYQEYNDKLMQQAMDGKTLSSTLFSIGGYYMGEIKYNKQNEKWEHLVVGGGFHAGGGYELTRNINQMVGPIPVTFSLSVGGGLEVDFKSSVLYESIPGYEWSNPQLSSVNDYLTSLRTIAYVEAFGGIGFDYSVIAAKIGVFGRVTMENTSSWLNRDYLMNASDRVKYGNKLTLEGVVGIRAVLKFLFFSQSYTFASLRYSQSWVFNHWNEIEAYWKKHAASPLTAANINTAVASYMSYMGIEDEYMFESNTLEDRSYLTQAERRWNTTEDTKPRLMALDPVNAAPTALQTNAYPYANPQVASDGSLFVYMSDGNSSAIEDTVASWAKKIGNSYIDQGPIVTDSAWKGFGDSNLQIAGEGNQIAAVWVRQKDKIEKNAGEEVSNEDILLMNNSAEVMAAIYDGTKWTTHRLTNNLNPDLAPVVSINQDKVFVAYRSVYSSNPNNPLDFSESDSIVYTVYDQLTGAWSDVETLYNGTNGLVMGLSTEMLSNGTTMIVYGVHTSSSNVMPSDDYVAGSDNEIIYAVIDTDEDTGAQANTWKTKGVFKNLQVTNDTNANENPQITSALFSDGVERFIIAWHTTGQEIGFVEHDIKLLAVNEDGEIYTGFVDSMNTLQSYNDIKIHPNFSFVKMPNADKKIENLSILWKEAEVELLPTETKTRDVIMAVKFGVVDEEVYLSSAIEVATLPDFTEVDHLSGHINNAAGTEVKVLILGTTYTTDANVVGTIQAGEGGADLPVTVSKSISAMYTATEMYSNRFHADNIQLSPNEIVIGYDLPIQFAIVNQGIQPIKSVNIDVGGQKTEFNDLLLFPNSSKGLIVPYTVPSLITDISYDMDVEYSDGEILSANGILKLDIPDLGISNTQIVEEAGGKRVLSVPIYNKNDTTIGNKGRVVKLGLYNNTIYTDEHLIGDVMSISDPNDLKLIDQGGFSVDVDFNLKDYLASLQLSEIPENGITVYLHSWVEDTDGNVVVEFDESNNDTKVWFENLAQKYNNKDILLLLEQTNEATHTSVNLSMQNTRMAPISSGNVLLNLLDRQGDIIESKYVATDALSLLSFGAEEKKSQNVPFSQKGDSVQAMFFIENADALDSTLSALTIEGVQLDFVKTTNNYAAQTSDMKNVRIFATASNSKALVSLSDAQGNILQSNQGYISVDQNLQLTTTGSTNKFTISVEPESAAGSSTNYEVTILNKESAKPKLNIVTRGPKNTAGDFSDNVEVLLPIYDVKSFNIAEAMYKVNDGDWIEVSYDGKTEQKLAEINHLGDYTVAVKVFLENGSMFELDPVTFTLSKGDMDENKTSISASKLEVIADGNDSSTIKVTLKDANDHLLAGRHVVLVSDSTHTVIQSDSSISNEEGEAFFTVTNTVAETVHFTAQDSVNGLTSLPIQVTFTPIPIDSHLSKAAASPETLLADGKEQSTITVTLLAENEVPLSGRQVSLEVNADSKSKITIINDVTDVNGIATFTVTNENAETVTYTAKDVATGTLLSPVQVNFIPGEVNAEKSSVAVSKTNLIADGQDKATFTVTLRDEHGHLLENRQVMLKADSGSSIIEPEIAITDAHGNSVFTVTNTKAETVNYAVIDIASEVELSAHQLHFSPGKVDYESSTVDVLPAEVVANGEAEATITVTLRDWYGNVVPGQRIEVKANNGNSIVTSSSTNTDAEGKAYINVSNTKAETVTYTVSYFVPNASGIGEDKISFEPIVRFVPDDLEILESDVSVASTEVLADGIDEASITVTLRDKNGNVLEGRDVELTADQGSSVINSEIATTDAAGQAIFTVTNTALETVEFFAKDVKTGKALTTSAKVNFVIGDVDVSKSTVMASKTELIADGEDEANITVILRGKGGHIITGREVSLVIGNDKYVAVTQVDGKAEFTVSNSMVGTVGYDLWYQLEDTTEKLLGQVVITYIPGELSIANSTVTTSRIEVAADGKESATITVTLRDKNDHTLSDREVLLIANGDNSVISPLNHITDGNGEAVFTVSNTVLEIVEYTTQDKQSGQRIDSVLISFVKGTVDATKSSMTVSKNEVLANGTDQAEITVTLRDAAGFALENRDVVLESSGFGSDIAQYVVTTNEQGEAIFTVSSRVLGNFEYKARDNQSGLWLASSVQVTFRMGDFDAGSSSVTASKTKVIANGSDYTNIIVTVADAAGHQINNRQVYLSASGGRSQIVAFNDFTIQGKANFSARNTQVESVTYIATDVLSGIQLGSIEIDFVPGDVDAGMSSALGSSTHVTANGTEFSRISIMLRDANNHPVSGHKVTLIPNSGSSVITAVNDTTNERGEAYFKVSNNEVESVEYTAQDEGSGYVFPPIQVNFVAGTLDAAMSNVDVSNQQVIANGSDSSTISVTLRDAYGHGLEGRQVLLHETGSVTFSSKVYSALTDSAGEAIFTVANAFAETVEYIAEDEASGLVFPLVQVNFVPGDVDEWMSYAWVLNNRVAANGTDHSMITVSLRDATGNALIGRQVVLVSDSNNTRIEAVDDGVTNTDGEAFFKVTNTVAETVRYTARDETSGLVLMQQVQVRFTAIDLDVTKSSVAVSRTHVIADGIDESTITVTLKDKNGTAFSGRKVLLTADRGSSEIIAVNAVTNSAGEAVFIVTNTKVETVAYTAVDETSGLTLTPVQVSFMEGDVDASTTSVTTSRTHVMADGKDESTIKVTLRDAGGHALVGRTVLLTASEGSSEITAVNEVTNSAGEAVFIVTNTQVETVAYTAVDETSGLTLSPVQVSFVEGDVDASTTSVTTSRTHVMADGKDESTITVTLRDTSGHALVGRTVLLTASEGSSEITAVNAVTNSAGEAVFIVTNTQVETIVYTAQDEMSGLTLTPVQVSFVAGDVDASTTSVTTSRTHVMADGKDESTITVTLRDTGGHALVGRTVLLTADGGNSEITAVNAVTNSAGEAVFIVTNTRVETIVYTAQDEMSGLELPMVTVSFIQGPSLPETGQDPIINPTPEQPDIEEPKGESIEDSSDKPNSIFKSKLINIDELMRSFKKKLQATESVDIASRFSDIENNWALDSIITLVRLDVIEGYEDGRIKPDQSITRAEFATMLVRLFAITGTAGDNSIEFADVSEGWARPAILALAQQGIVKGYADGTFKPDETITREEMVVIIMRLIDAEALSQSENVYFTDISSAGKYAKESIDTAVRAGLINGYKDHTFKPKGHATRAEVVSILLRLLELDSRLKELMEQL